VHVEAPCVGWALVTRLIFRTPAPGYNAINCCRSLFLREDFGIAKTIATDASKALQIVSREICHVLARVDIKLAHFLQNSSLAEYSSSPLRLVSWEIL
jgi:hypothetical protein